MTDTLFQRYGGFATISRVVMAVYDKVLDSEVIGPYFENVDMRRLMDHQTKFISSVLGGPASYSNEALRQLHAHLDVTAAAFEEMIALFKDTLEDFEFEAEDIAYIVDDLESRRPYIVSPFDA